MSLKNCDSAKYTFQCLRTINNNSNTASKLMNNHHSTEADQSCISDCRREVTKCGKWKDYQEKERLEPPSLSGCIIFNGTNAGFRSETTTHVLAAFDPFQGFVHKHALSMMSMEGSGKKCALFIKQ